MSTRSLIFYKDEENNNYKGIYCHFDGYIDGVGQELIENYRNIDDIKKLIELGDISSLGSNINETIAYSRDRGESKHQYIAKDLKEISEIDSWQEYVYVFDGGEWYACDEPEKISEKTLYEICWKPRSLEKVKKDKSIEKELGD